MALAKNEINAIFGGRKVIIASSLFQGQKNSIPGWKILVLIGSIFFEALDWF